MLTLTHYGRIRFIGCGILYYLAPQLSAFAKIPPFLAPAILISTFTLVTLTLTALVCGRLWFHQQEMRRTLGPQYGSPYKKTIIMCTLSCILIAVPSLAYVILFSIEDSAKASTSIIPLLILPHICVSS